LVNFANANVITCNILHLSFKANNETRVPVFTANRQNMSSTVQSVCHNPQNHDIWVTLNKVTSNLMYN